MMDYKFKKALVLAPHTDDGELGCGGTIKKMLDTGTEVYYAAFSACQQSVGPDFPEDILITEVKAATQKLGIHDKNLILFDYEVRTFNFKRQQILDDILRLKHGIGPDVVFTPSLQDIHQDHFTIANEALRAFKWSTILCYELPWNNFNFQTQCFVSLQNKHVETKIDALKEYKSQAHRPYANEEFIRGLAKTRGVQSNNEYAETFEIIRLQL